MQAATEQVVQAQSGSISALAWTVIQAARRVVVDPTQSKTSLASHSIWEGVVRQFVKTHQNIGTLPWLHMPEATDLVTGVTTEADLARVSAAASPTARLQAALELIMEKLLAQAQTALELEALTQHPDFPPKQGRVTPPGPCRMKTQACAV